MNRSSQVQTYLQLKESLQYAVQTAIEAELYELVWLAVLSLFTQSNSSASTLILKGNVILRFCADFSTGLNRTLKLHQFHIFSP